MPYSPDEERDNPFVAELRSTPRQYAVFISYRHTDNKEPGREWASWLHHVLESYEVPPDLVGQNNQHGEAIPASLYPVFRDEEELGANADLSSSIRLALANSRLLVIICSPRAVESRFVAEEIRYFKELGKADRILALIIDGEPNSSGNPNKECLPEPMRFGVARADGVIDWRARTDPLAADVRAEGSSEPGWTTAAAYREALDSYTVGSRLTASEIKEKVHAYEQRLELAKLKIISGALGVPLGELTRRDKALQLERARVRVRRARKLAVAFAVLAILAVIGGLFAWQQSYVVRVREAEQRKLLHDASMGDYDAARQRIEQQGRRHEGIAHLARALDWEPANRLAAARLWSTIALHAEESRDWPVCVLRHGAPIVTAAFSPDGSKVVTASEDNTAQIWEVGTGHPIGLPLRHEDKVWSAVFSPDGTKVLTASKDKTARLWDAATGKPVGEPLLHEASLSSASFSPDGSRIITASWSSSSDNGVACLWDVTSGKPIGEPLRHQSIVGVAFSPDGSKLVTWGMDHTARIWEADSGMPLAEPLPHRARIWSAGFSPDGSKVVTASEDKTARMWTVATGSPFGEPLWHEGEVTSAVFSPDGTKILTASKDKTARLWDAATGNPLGEPLHHEASVNSAAFSPDGYLVVTSSGDGTARLWDATTGKPLGEPLRHEDDISRVAFSPDGLRVVTASWDNTARVWDVATGKLLGEPLRHKGAVISAAFSADGSKAITASADSTACLWDVGTGKRLSEPLHHNDEVKSAAFSPDGSKVVTASADCTARLWEAATGKPIGEPLRHPLALIGVAFSFDGSKIVTWCSGTPAQGGWARVWDAVTGKPLTDPLPHRGNITRASLSRDGSKLVTASTDQTARVWNVDTSELLGQVNFGAIVTSAEFRPDGSTFLTASDNKITLYAVATGKPVGEPIIHQFMIMKTALSPDGSKVVGASDRGGARMWELATGKPLGAPMYHEGGVNSVAFSRDGSRVVTASDDLFACVWDAATGKLLGDRLRHAAKVNSANFSTDGRKLITASADNTARLWHLLDDKELPLPVPAWARDWARALVGWRFTADGELVRMPAEERVAVLNAPREGDDAWVRLARWVVTPSARRTIHPDSPRTLHEIAERERDFGTKESLESSLRYDATMPLARLMLAGVLEREDAERKPQEGDPTVPARASFLRDYDLKNLPRDAEIWARAVKILHSQKAAEPTQRALEKLEKLDPAKAKAMREEISRDTDIGLDLTRGTDG